MPEPGASAAGADREQLTSRLVSQAITRAQEADREAVGFLYARYADNVYGYVRSIVNDSHEAEDLTQQVFAKLVNVIGKYEEREVPFLAWILRVARDLSVDHLRRREVLVLRHSAGLSPTEIATLTGRSEGSVSDDPRLAKGAARTSLF